jgi:hypothetical protein
MNESVVYFKVINILIKIYNKNLFIKILKESALTLNISKYKSFKNCLFIQKLIVNYVNLGFISFGKTETFEFKR